MKIATWNIERLKHRKDVDQILDSCKAASSDIFILTETDHRVCPEYETIIRTDDLYKLDPVFYGEKENRVSIYTDYKCVRRYETFDSYTSVCAELETERGSLIVYGTIIGVFGNRHPSFQEDLLRQADDIRRIAETGKPVCVCGDFNLSFGDNYYYTKEGRELLERLFADLKIKLLTCNMAECIDHIAISENFLQGFKADVTEWNKDKHLSDHKGIMAVIQRERVMK